MTLEEIQQAIPHRPPFLWLDRVSFRDDRRIVAHKFLDPGLDVFRGHYPHFPLFPAVLQCEAALQAAAVLIAPLVPVGEGNAPVATRVQNAQFRRMVRPGETLDIEVELTERLANAFYLKGKVSVNGQTATRLEFACSAAKMPG